LRTKKREFVCACIVFFAWKIFRSLAVLPILGDFVMADSVEGNGKDTIIVFATVFHFRHHFFLNEIAEELFKPNFQEDLHNFADIEHQAEEPQSCILSIIHFIHPAAPRGALKPFCPRRKCVGPALPVRGWGLVSVLSLYGMQGTHTGHSSLSFAS
jgi:hypothetical protein